MRLAGYRYLTVENIYRFLLHPVTLLAAALLLFLVSVYTFVDMSALIVITACLLRGRRITVYRALRIALRSLRRALLPANVTILLSALLLLPCFISGVAAGFLRMVSLPAGAREYLRPGSPLVLILAAVFAAMVLRMLTQLYTLPVFVLEHADARGARRESRRLSQGRHVKDLAHFIAFQVIYMLLTMGVIGIGASLTALIRRLLRAQLSHRRLIAGAVWDTIIIIAFILLGLAVPLCCVAVTRRYFRLREAAAAAAGGLRPAPGNAQESASRSVYEDTAADGADGEDTVRSLHDSGEDIPVISESGPAGRLESSTETRSAAAPAQQDARRARRRRHLRRFSQALIPLTIAGFAASGGLILSGFMNPSIEYVRTMEVTAHRGASEEYPENTMAAFRAAAELHADWIELDVQQSRDGEIFVLHDPSFLRTCGVDRKVWELDWAEIRTLDAGSWKGVEFAGEKVPGLGEVLAFAEESGIRLNIELKPTGHETDFEEAVVGLIREAGLEDRCMITSQKYSLLRRVKELCPEIRTAYVLSFAYGNLHTLDDADVFSIKTSSINADLVSNVHNAGKELLVWTVNTRTVMNRMIELGVDNLVTDRITLARETIYENKFSDLVDAYMELAEIETEAETETATETE